MFTALALMVGQMFKMPFRLMNSDEEEVVDNNNRDESTANDGNNPQQEPVGTEHHDDDNDGTDNNATSTSTALLNSSFSRWSATADENSVHYPSLSESALIHKCPNETWVECMRFLNRDALQTLQLVANKFDLMVEKYFGVFPLRRVHRCKVRTKRRQQAGEEAQMQILMICLGSEPTEPGRTIETDSELHLWLQHCYVDCLEFINFHFTPDLLQDLERLDQRLVRLNFCVLDYTRRVGDDAERPLSEQLVQALFQIAIFKNCAGAVFSFEKRCANFRPSVGHLLTNLCQKSLVFDFAGFRPDQADQAAISQWLNAPPMLALAPQQQSSSNASKALSLRGLGVNFDDDNDPVVVADSLVAMANRIEQDFLHSTRRQPFILDTRWEQTAWELRLELENRNLARTLTNAATGEKLKVTLDGERVRIVRE